MNEIRSPSALARSTASENTSSSSTVADPAQARSASRMTVRDVLVLLFYNGPLLRKCVLLGLFVGLMGAALTRTHYTADSLVLY